MRKPKILFFLVCFFCSVHLLARQKKFPEWNSIAFCSYTMYHPFKYVKADNNWEIIRALQTPHTRIELDSIGIGNTDSQLMLLQIEGLIDERDDGKWISLMPVLDSLQTVAVRAFSRNVADDLYPRIKDDCSALVDFLKQQKQSESAFAILFSYVLDGKVLKAFHTYEEMQSAATWEGACWALYFPRDFSCGTNTYDKRLAVCWNKNQPEFVRTELNRETFIGPFLEDYEKYGKIVSPAVADQAQNLGITAADGSLRIPVIDTGDNDAALNVFSHRITDTIVRYFTDSGIATAFQEKFGIDSSRKKLASVMLYHEVMWELVDLLVADRVIHYPLLWENGKKESVYSVVFIKN